MCRELVEKLTEDNGDDNLVYVYAIHMNVGEVFHTKMSETKRKIWDRKNTRFGLITKRELSYVSITWNFRTGCFNKSKDNSLSTFNDERTVRNNGWNNERTNRLSVCLPS